MLHEHRFRAMNTDVAVWLWNLDPQAQAGAILSQVEELFTAIEAEMSRFRPDSGLCRLNRGAGNGPQPVSAQLGRVVSLALAAARNSGGVFDPTVLMALEHAGYDRSFDLLAARGSTGPADVVPARPDWRQVVLNPAGHTIFLPKGTGLDLGGIAKGWAVDQAVDLLAGWGEALVNAGGDMRSSGAPGGTPWPVAVEDPFVPTRPGPVLGLERGAIATSSIGGRHWQRNGEPRHHLIDPRTGRPSTSDLHTVTVLAGTTVQAEVAAKVALILGSKAGKRHLEAQGLSGLLVERDGWEETVGVLPVMETTY